MSQIAVTARLVVREGRESEAEKVLAAALEGTRREDGCIAYNLFRCPFNSREKIFIERWRSREDLELHGKQPYILALRESADTLFEGPSDVLIWDADDAV